MAIEIETTIINVTLSTDSGVIQVTVPQSFGVGEGSMSDLEVKQANERNANTNEFNDAEKAFIATFDLTSVQDGDELYFDTASGKWKNRRGKVILTQAAYDILTPDPDILYYITA